jgi:hypothetical protein
MASKGMTDMPNSSEVDAPEKSGGHRKRRRFELVDYKRNVCWPVDAINQDVGRCQVVDMNCDVAHFGILGTEVRIFEVPSR